VATTLKKGTVLKNALMLSGLSMKQCLISTFGIVLMLGLVVLLWMINSYFMFLIAFFPAAFIAILEICFNLFGNGLRDALNPSLRGADN
jgi:oligopeptide transport system permease protein